MDEDLYTPRPPTSEIDVSEPIIIDGQDDDDDGIWQVELDQREVAYTVYLEMSKSFYAWEREHTSQTLIGLAQNHAKRKPRRRPRPIADTKNQEGETVTFTCEEFTSSSHTASGIRRSQRHRIASEPIIQAKPFDPYPRYTACTPTSTNLSGPLDPQLRALFAPFADDSRFRLDSYLASFGDFVWQNEYPDPDSEIIQLEVVRRLVFSHRFSYADIDNLRIFPFPLRKNNREGLIFYSLHRDFPWWPASHDSDLEQLQGSYVDDGLSLYENTLKDLPLFCPNLSCLYSFCSIHGLANPVFPSKPKLTTAGMVDRSSRKHPPCKRDCHQSMEFENLNMVNNHWSDEDISLFASVMKLAPDTLPCDLAVICRKPCFEMYIQRLSFFSDEEITSYNRDVEEQRQHSTESRAIEFYEDEPVDPDTGFSPITMVPPCYHPGACNQFADCLCFQKKQRCQRGCRCAKTCEIRFKGCKCSHKKTTRRGRPCAFDTECACRLRRRECDPELCKGCNAKSQSSGDKNCKNVDIQKGRFYQIRVKGSAYGLGAFAVDHIPKDRFIGEYVGESFKEDSLPKFLSPMQKHIKLNYLFTWTEKAPDISDNGMPTLSLDSWNVGNETRYLNHSGDGKQSCASGIYLVNGIHKIVLYTVKQVKSGQELTLDYGDHYWLPESDEEN